MTNTTHAFALHVHDRSAIALAPDLRHTVAAQRVAHLADARRAPEACWGSSPAMQAMYAILGRVADSNVGVLLRGESGVGKEVIARELHHRSGRRTKPFVKVSCAALPAELLESELFGHERGAFTGAWTARVGKFESAQHGTIMLDEIGEMPPALQAKILHVLQDGAFTRLGSNRAVEVDVRVIAATHCDLEAMIDAQTFREDLYYRLQVIELRVPPLRERCDEIPMLAGFFLAKYAEAFGRPATKPSSDLLRALEGHTWPGNIRELENTMKRCVVLQDESLIVTELLRLAQGREGRHASRPLEPATLPAAPIAPMHDAFPAVDASGGADAGLHAVGKRAALDAERRAIFEALERFRWNRRKTSEYLNVSYKTLLNKIKECGITASAAP